MKYEFISADCHIDLIWLPPDLFTSNSRADLRERMPFVTDTRRGKAWVAKNGAKPPKMVTEMLYEKAMPTPRVSTGNCSASTDGRMPL